MLSVSSPNSCANCTYCTVWRCSYLQGLKHSPAYTLCYFINFTNSKPFFSLWLQCCPGVAGAVLLPVAGLGVGVAQVVRGAVNTPEAVRELNKGRYWDQVHQQHPTLWQSSPSVRA